MSEKEPDTELLKLINGSGFPFQMAAKERIQSTSDAHGWEVVAEEHPWRHPSAGSAGFVDLVLHENRPTLAGRFISARLTIWRLSQRAGTQRHQATH
jgi:hypothetical protein